MTPTSEDIRSIYTGIAVRQGLGVDRQGWNSENPIFRRLITKLRPSVIVEVGVWKGASLLHMADICLEMELPTTLYGVDAWFGHLGQMIGNPPASPIPNHWTSPTHYEQFLFNVRGAGHDDRIIPVWQLTRWGADCLAAWGVVADLIYVDAGHDEEPVLDDIGRYWPLLRPGGIMFGDDFSPSYPGVQRAVERFRNTVGRAFRVEGEQWCFDPK